VCGGVNRIAETFKCTLSQQDETSATLNCNGEEYCWTLTAETFAGCAASLLTRLKKPVVQALQDAFRP
jgi:molecular chaperone HscC